MRTWICTSLLLTACAGGQIGVDEPVPAFALQDVNPSSATFEQAVGPDDFQDQVSGWYFGWATCPLCQAHIDELDRMQGDVDALDTPVPITLIGINQVGYESGNDTITSDVDLPWLQDTQQADVFGAWPPARIRELKIVGRDGQVAATFDLNQDDPVDEQAYQRVLDALVQAAQQAPTQEPEQGG